MAGSVSLQQGLGEGQVAGPASQSVSQAVSAARSRKSVSFSPMLLPPAQPAGSTACQPSRMRLAASVGGSRQLRWAYHEGGGVAGQQRPLWQRWQQGRIAEDAGGTCGGRQGSEQLMDQASMGGVCGSSDSGGDSPLGEQAVDNQSKAGSPAIRPSPPASNLAALAARHAASRCAYEQHAHRAAVDTFLLDLSRGGSIGKRPGKGHWRSASGIACLAKVWQIVLRCCILKRWASRHREMA